MVVFVVSNMCSSEIVQIAFVAILAIVHYRYRDSRPLVEKTAFSGLRRYAIERSTYPPNYP